jgi:hypothetical protein
MVSEGILEFWLHDSYPQILHAVIEIYYYHQVSDNNLLFINLKAVFGSFTVSNHLEMLYIWTMSICLSATDSCYG